MKMLRALLAFGVLLTVTPSLAIVPQAAAGRHVELWKKERPLSATR